MGDFAIGDTKFFARFGVTNKTKLGQIFNLLDTDLASVGAIFVRGDVLNGRNDVLLSGENGEMKKRASNDDFFLFGGLTRKMSEPVLGFLKSEVLFPVGDVVGHISGQFPELRAQ